MEYYLFKYYVSRKMVYIDKRGYLHSIKDLSVHAKEVLVSHSHSGVLRGLHYSPYRKQIYVVNGTIYDFWFSPETGEHWEGILKSGEQLVVPANAMHGFYAISEVDMLYFLEDKFSPEFDITYHWSSPGLPLILDFPKTNLIISEKDDNAPFYHQYDYALLGATGFLGSYTEKVLKEQGKRYVVISERLSEIDLIQKKLKKSGCKYVLCAAGISGRPTTAWCEDHEFETYQVNYLQMLNLMELTHKMNLHLTIYGTGMLYEAADTKSKFTEKDLPNLRSGVYVKYRVELESHLHLYPNVLCLRILFPITADGHSKCFLTKMSTRTSNVHNLNSPITVVPELFPLISKLVESNVTGPLNFVSKGVISLPQLMTLFGIEHQVAAGDAKPGIELDTEKLEQTSQTNLTVVKDALQKLVPLWKKANSK